MNHCGIEGGYEELSPQEERGNLAVLITNISQETWSIFLKAQRES
jgi:hypothetical protein